MKIGPCRPLLAAKIGLTPTNFGCQKWSGYFNLQETASCLVNFSVNIYTACTACQCRHIGYAVGLVVIAMCDIVSSVHHPLFMLRNKVTCIELCIILIKEQPSRVF